ncbi:hypothetical protein [Clostridium tertium]|uniref:Uncharacterized protein n=1 Tax=Clostridium tertium TaxID=1559 RepID=A0A6N3DC06_9CLOT
MGKCPFWSTKKERVNCYSECPMHTITNENEVCPFKELSISGNKSSIIDNMNEELFYSQERYLNYGENDKVINY